MRLLFLGSGEFGLPTLRALAASHEIVGVVTQPDRPAGRGRELTPTPIGAWASGHLAGVPLLKPENINETSVTGQVRALAGPGVVDAWVVIAFGQKLGWALLEGVFAVNLHASLLPRWRGAAPINAAMLAGDAVTGNTVITLADRMDAGEILGQSTRAIEPAQTAGALHDALSEDGPALVERVLREHSAGVLARRAQDESLATRAPKLSKADGWIDFEQPAERCRWRVHGLTPWPGVTVRVATAAGEQELKLTLVQEVHTGRAAPGGAARGSGRVDSFGGRTERNPSAPADGSPGQARPGTLIDPALGLVQCGGGTLLRLLMVTPAGKRSMEWGEFVQGRTIEAGTMVHGGRRA